MKQSLIRLLPLIFITVSFASCRTQAPTLDYRALAQASIKLGMDIDFDDNHALYLAAAEWIGVPYRSDGNNKYGTDCSGLTTQIYRTVYHRHLPRSSKEQMKKSKRLSRHKLREGDLVFFSSPRSRKTVAHVGIYLKNGKFIHASTSQGVIVSDLDEDYYRHYWMRGGRIR